MVSAIMEQKNSNTPFVLASFRAHRLVDGHDALCIYVHYQSKENIKEGKRKFEEAARKYADSELCHDETFLREMPFLAIESFTCTFYLSMSNLDSILPVYTVLCDRMETVSQ